MTDLFELLGRGYDCVCGGRVRCNLRVDYGSGDKNFDIYVDNRPYELSMLPMHFKGVLGFLSRSGGSYVFGERRLSEDEVRFLVEGVKALALCSPDLRYLLGWSEWVLGVVYDVVYLAERVGLEDGFEVDYGFCHLSVDSEEGWLYLYLLCDWAGDKMDVEVLREEGKATVEFKRGYGHARVLINVKEDGEWDIIIHSDGEALTQFYKDMRNKVEKGTDEILGTLKELGRTLSLKHLFP